MKVYFSHGKESGSWGSKITGLAKVAKDQGFRVSGFQGFRVNSIDYSGISDPDLRVEHLLSLLNDAEEAFLLVGSSMGGYVSLVASEQVDAKGVFLLAPALYMQGYKKQAYTNGKNVEIVHGWSDDIIPPENSIKFAKQMDCTLHLISGDHRLNSSIVIVEQLFSQYLDQVQTKHPRR
jgi:alpha/beta superfamily hydrolase